jgi:hypothetical protein
MRPFWPFWRLYSSPVSDVEHNPAGVVENGSNVSRNGCTMNVRQICQNIFNQPELE